MERHDFIEYETQDDGQKTEIVRTVDLVGMLPGHAQFVLDSLIDRRNTLREVLRHDPSKLSEVSQADNLIHAMLNPLIETDEAPVIGS